MSSDTLIDRLYDAEQFRQDSSIWQTVVSQHFQRVLNRDTAVLNWADPATLVEKASGFLDSSDQPADSDRLAELLQQMLDAGQNLHHPRYIGHQVPASLPLAGLFDAIGTVTNQPMAIYEMGPWATAVEHAVIGKLCEKVGWKSQHAGGVLTSGGSLGNLTALLTARNMAFPNSWQDGVPNNAVLLTQGDAHYCVARSAGILGLGTRQVIKIPVDSQRRMDVDALQAAIADSKRDGKKIMAVVACACATPIGAFDPIAAVADVCQNEGIWLHVDAAHGGAALMSQQHRSLLEGVERADSVVWDAHKMLFVPALCAAVLYKDREHRFQSFQQDAPYLFDPSNPGMAEFDSGVGTIECTKRALGYGLWGIWSMFGDRLFEQLVDHTFGLCRYLYDQVLEADDFEAVHKPDGNIFVFRHLPQEIRDATLEEQNQLQFSIRRTLIESGRFYIVQTTIDGMVGLRICVMNPATTQNDVDGLLNAIRSTSVNLMQVQH